MASRFQIYSAKIDNIGLLGSHTETIGEVSPDEASLKAEAITLTSESEDQVFWVDEADLLDFYNENEAPDGDSLRSEGEEDVISINRENFWDGREKLYDGWG